jgi:hypothetical protein
VIGGEKVGEAESSEMRTITSPSLPSIVLEGTPPPMPDKRPIRICGNIRIKCVVAQ